eukprot:8697959-Lingulodinium_polyedra.AAC.1
MYVRLGATGERGATHGILQQRANGWHWPAWHKGVGHYNNRRQALRGTEPGARGSGRTVR